MICKLCSYVQSVMALAGAALIKLIGNPLYNPLNPACLKIDLIAPNAVLYSGMF